MVFEISVMLLRFPLLSLHRALLDVKDHLVSQEKMEAEDFLEKMYVGIFFNSLQKHAGKMVLL